MFRENINNPQSEGQHVLDHLDLANSPHVYIKCKNVRIQYSTVQYSTVLEIFCRGDDNSFEWRRSVEC